MSSAHLAVSGSILVSTLWAFVIVIAAYRYTASSQQNVSKWTAPISLGRRRFLKSCAESLTVPPGDGYYALLYTPKLTVHVRYSGDEDYNSTLQEVKLEWPGQLLLSFAAPDVGDNSTGDGLAELWINNDLMRLAGVQDLQLGPPTAAGAVNYSRVEVNSTTVEYFVVDTTGAQLTLQHVVGNGFLNITQLIIEHCHVVLHHQPAGPIPLVTVEPGPSEDVRGLDEVPGTATRKPVHIPLLQAAAMTGLA